MSKKGFFSKKNLFIIISIISISLFEGVSAKMIENKVNLPKTVGVWTKPDSARIIDSNNIFDYMNGAGELYLAYRFDHLEVYEYTSEQQKNILVEVYIMKTSNDAFGLLSIDWSGNPVNLSSLSASQSYSSIAPSTRALYHRGLLLLCSDNIFARIMAYQETPESREAIFTLGKSIVKDRKVSIEPEILKIFPQSFGSEWILRNDRIGYFRSFLVLNSFYYLSHQNILNLNHSTEAVIAPYEKTTETSKKIKLLIIKYASSTQSKQALKKFLKIYLPEHTGGIIIKNINKQLNFFNIEDGWLGYRLESKYIAIVFESPTRNVAEMVIEHISKKIINKEY